MECAEESEGERREGECAAAALAAADCVACAAPAAAGKGGVKAEGAKTAACGGEKLPKCGDVASTTGTGATAAAAAAACGCDPKDSIIFLMTAACASDAANTRCNCSKEGAPPPPRSFMMIDARCCAVVCAGCTNPEQCRPRACWGVTLPTRVSQE